MSHVKVPPIHELLRMEAVSELSLLAALMLVVTPELGAPAAIDQAEALVRMTARKVFDQQFPTEKK
jgi:hypothetical protein